MFLGLVYLYQFLSCETVYSVVYLQKYMRLCKSASELSQCALKLLLGTTRVVNYAGLVRGKKTA